ncbi:unnamed protein product [Rotaria sp. Silwood2]|nr:unnamed protein product [Rotaria sp. Silwood2]CAF4353598.1 unnamed protein product [Rotaria sp. Silwood2]
MLPVGISNIVSDRQGVLFYTVSWSGDEYYTAKICRITEAQTPHPIQECIENYQLYNDIITPLALNEKYDILVTAVTDDEFESVPAGLNKTTLAMQWINRHFFGAGVTGHYRCHTNTGDILWIGGDRNLLKFKYNGQNLINNYTQPNDAGINFVLDKQKQIIIRPWQNMTDLPWKFVVSSYDVSTPKIKIRWNWYPPSSIVANDDMTSPTIDDKGTVYMSSMPLVFAIDNLGKTVWTSKLATSSEMKTFQLISYCIAMNLKRRTLYVVSGSPIFQKTKFLYFITAVNMDTGKVIKRIDVSMGSNKYITPQCPILIGEEMFYFSWLTGQYPQSVPFKIAGIKQV